jgi:Delta3,5-Delta2,4-dienoyl-CoA isomerase
MTVKALQTHPHPMDKDHEFLSIDIPDGYPHVTIVRLNRPSKKNAIHAGMWREIGHVFSCLGRGGGRDGDGEHAESRCVLLTGNGDAFCSGIDIQDLGTTTLMTPTTPNITGNSTCTDVARRGIAMMSKLEQMQACFTQLETCPIPVVVAMHGVCIGAGMDLACCADIRLSASNTIFSVREVAMGLAADVGTLQRLPKITGNASWVSHVCLTGCYFNAQDALQIGLISQIVHGPTVDALLHDAVQLCHSITIHSPVAVLGTKKALLYARDHTVADSLNQISSFNAMALQSDDLTLAIQAAKEKKQATFPSMPTYSRL